MLVDPLLEVVHPDVPSSVTLELVARPRAIRAPVCLHVGDVVEAAVFQQKLVERLAQRLDATLRFVQRVPLQAAPCRRAAAWARD